MISFLAGMLTLILANYNFFFEKQTAQIDISDTARFVLDEITSNVRGSLEIIPSVALGGQIYVTGTKTLILQLPGLDPGGQSIAGVFDHLIFFQDQTETSKLRKKVFPAPQSSRGLIDQVLTSNLGNIEFTYNNGDLSQANEVAVNLTLVKSGGNKIQEINDQSRTTLRNF